MKAGGYRYNADEYPAMTPIVNSKKDNANIIPIENRYDLLQDNSLESSEYS